MTFHTTYNGPYDAFGQKHGVSDTKDGREFWAHGYLHRDPIEHGHGPAQITRFADGTVKITFAQYGMPHAVSEAAVQWKNQIGDVYSYENWQFGLKHGPSVYVRGGSTEISQWQFGKRHGYESKQAAGSDRIMLRKWTFDNLDDVNGHWSVHRAFQRPAPEEAGTFSTRSANFAVGQHPSQLYTAARGMVELSESSDDEPSDVLIADVPAPEPAPESPAPERKVTRNRRTTKKPLRYRSSHY